MLASLFKRREGCGWWSENRWFYSRSSICNRSWNCAVARRHCKKSGAYNSNWGVLLVIHMTGWSSTGASRGRRRRCQTDWRTRSSLSVLHRISSKQSGMCFLSSSSSSSVLVRIDEGFHLSSCIIFLSLYLFYFTLFHFQFHLLLHLQLGILPFHFPSCCFCQSPSSCLRGIWTPWPSWGRWSGCCARIDFIFF